MDYILSNPDSVLRAAGLTEEAYSEIMRDGHLKALVEIRLAASATMEWDVQLTEDVAINEAVDAMLRTFDVPTMGISFLDGVLYGYQLFEVVWSEKKGLLMPRLIWRPREWFSFNVDGDLLFHSATHPNGKIVRHMNPESQGDDEVQYAFLVAQNRPTCINPYGQALLSGCYWNVFFKRHGRTMWAEFIERFAMPWVKSEYPSGYTEEEQNTLLTNLRAMVRGGAIVMPEGTKTEMLSTAGSTGDAFDKFIHDAKVENTILVVGHESVVNATAGKLGGDNTAMTVAQWIQENDSRFIAGVWNELIRWFCNVNFGVDSPAPTFRLFQQQDVDMELAQRDEILRRSQGVKRTKQSISRAYNLPEDEFDVIEADGTVTGNNAALSLLRAGV